MNRGWGWDSGQNETPCGMWALRTKSGQKCSRIGGEKFKHLHPTPTTIPPIMMLTHCWGQACLSAQRDPLILPTLLASPGNTVTLAFIEIDQGSPHPYEQAVCVCVSDRTAYVKPPISYVPPIAYVPPQNSCVRKRQQGREEGREGGREEERKGGREGGKEGRREGGREGDDDI